MGEDCLVSVCWPAVKFDTKRIIRCSGLGLACSGCAKGRNFALRVMNSRGRAACQQAGPSPHAPGMGGPGGCKLALHFHLQDPAGRDATSNSCKTCPGLVPPSHLRHQMVGGCTRGIFGEAGSPGSGRRGGQLAGVGPCWALLPGRGCLSEQVVLSRAGHRGRQPAP